MSLMKDLTKIGHVSFGTKDSRGLEKFRLNLINSEIEYKVEIFSC
jgi:hypothetical protein